MPLPALIAAAQEIEVKGFFRRVARARARETKKILPGRVGDLITCFVARAVKQYRACRFSLAEIASPDRPALGLPSVLLAIT
jgi:hypothetical protein